MKNLLPLILFFLFLPFANAAGEDTVVVSKVGKEYNLAAHVQVLVLPDDFPISDEAIATGKMDTAFKPANMVKIDPGNYKNVKWLKVSVKNFTNKQLYLSMPFVGIEEMLLFETTNNGIVQVRGNGTTIDSIPSYRQSLVYFDLQMAKGESHTLYIKIFRLHMDFVPMYCSTSEPMIKSFHVNDIFYGLIYGLFLIIIFYNLILYLRIRDLDNLAYSIWVFFLLVQLAFYRGHAVEFIWPWMPQLGKYPDVFAGLTGISHLIFTITFLKLRKASKKLYITGLVIIALYAIVAGFNLLRFIGIQYQYLNPGHVALIAGIFAVTAGIYVYRKGFKPAYLFVLAKVCYFSAIFVFYFYVMGHFGHSNLAYNAMHWGSGLEVIFFSLALSYKINLMKKEKDEARKDQIKLLEENRDLINNQKIRLEEMVGERTEQLNAEKEKSELLLRNILPHETAEELKRHGVAKAHRYEAATILFADIKGFTYTAEKLSADELVKEIDFYFGSFDNIMEEHGLEKIKTIGDAYMAVGGMPENNSATPADVVNAAISMQKFMEDTKEQRIAAGKDFFEIRIGINTGPVVAGVVGTKKFQYDIWGDAVNMASRMEECSEPGRINVSGRTFNLIKNEFSCFYRGKLDAKNKGKIDMYFVESRKLQAV